MNACIVRKLRRLLKHAIHYCARCKTISKPISYSFLLVMHQSINSPCPEWLQRASVRTSVVSRGKTNCKQFVGVRSICRFEGFHTSSQTSWLHVFTMCRLSVSVCFIFSVLFPPQHLVAGFCSHKNPAGSASMPRHQIQVMSKTTNRRILPRFSPTPLFQTKSAGDDPKLQETDTTFWLQQKQLIQDLSDVSNKPLRAKQKEQFAKRRIALVGDTAFLSFFVFCGMWSAFENPFVALSYILGATLGLAYAYGLGEFSVGRSSLCTWSLELSFSQMNVQCREVRRKHRG